jgi:hypothetical protein
MLSQQVCFSPLKVQELSLKENHHLITPFFLHKDVQKKKKYNM